MEPNHPSKIASRCKHTVHLSSPSHKPWCPQCTISAAKADLERCWKKFEAEGGIKASAYMRDRCWNAARLQYVIKNRRVKEAVHRDILRQEYERSWDVAHQRYLAKHGVLNDSHRSACAVCERMKKSEQPHADPVVSFTTAWWEREGGLAIDHILVPRTPPHSTRNKDRTWRLHPKLPSELGNFIRSYRKMRTVSDVQRRAWEDRYNLDRAIRRKYDVPHDFDIDVEFLTSPMPAPHARYHHQQVQDGLYASKRRANRNKRRAEDYRPSRSLLTFSELAEDTILDDAELEELKSIEEAAQIRRLTDAAAAEVGYLYFVGIAGLLKRWKDDVEKSNLSLIYRNCETDLMMGLLDEDVVMTEEEEEEEEEEEY